MKRKGILILLAGLLTLASCSSLYEELLLKTEEEPKQDVNVDVDVTFKTLILGYDFESGIATAAGITDEGVTYKWYLNDAPIALIDGASGATCNVDSALLKKGKNRLVVIATVDGVDYSADCTIEN